MNRKQKLRIKINAARRRLAQLVAVNFYRKRRRYPDAPLVKVLYDPAIHYFCQHCGLAVPYNDGAGTLTGTAADLKLHVHTCNVTEGDKGWLVAPSATETHLMRRNAFRPPPVDERGSPTSTDGIKLVYGPWAGSKTQRSRELAEAGKADGLSVGHFKHNGQ